MGGKNGCFSLAYIMREFDCPKDAARDILRMEQSRRGKIGGAKNKGYILYNDGVKHFKYTATQQNSIPFETFLRNNAQFNKGRIDVGVITCPKCSKEGSSYPAMKRHHFDNCKRII